MGQRSDAKRIRVLTMALNDAQCLIGKRVKQLEDAMHTVNVMTKHLADEVEEYNRKWK